VALSPKRSIHGYWTSSAIFVFAAAGFAIGLKNIWQFPHHVSQYGGGAYLLVYALFLGLLGWPLMLSHALVARLSRLSPVHAIRDVVHRHHLHRAWKLLGWWLLIGGFLVLIYYSVVASWMLAYTVRAAVGALDGLTYETAGSYFSTFVRDPEKQLFWHFLFVAATFTIAARGVRAGLESLARIGVPVVFLLLWLLVGYGVGVGEFDRGLSHFLLPDFTRLTADGLISAIGDAFFSLGLGVGVMMMYTAYLHADVNITRLSFYVILADVVTGLLAGLAIYPLLFAAGESPASGPELVFQALAVSFDVLPLGSFLRFLFFLMLTVIALLSTVALTEPFLAWLTEWRQCERERAARIGALVVWVFGIIGILSFQPWQFSFSLFGLVKTLGFFDLLLVATSLFMLPVAGLALAVFAAWALRPEVSREALKFRSPCAHDIWLWFTRLAVPALLLLVLFNARLFL
jgi:NSS family neurotransmitter:Na+ symporter